MSLFFTKISRILDAEGLSLSQMQSVENAYVFVFWVNAVYSMGWDGLSWICFEDRMLINVLRVHIVPDIFMIYLNSAYFDTKMLGQCGYLVVL